MIFITWSLSYLSFSRPRDIVHVYRLIFQGESKFRGFKGDKGYIEGQGEQRERQPQGPGQGVVHFFNYTYDTCLYANFSMGIRISRLRV